VLVAKANIISKIFSQFYPGKSLSLYHFQKNDNPGLNLFLSPFFERQSAVLRASRTQICFGLPTMVGDIFLGKVNFLALSLEIACCGP